MSVFEESYKALNRLTKWRTIFAGWQLGTRPKGDPEGDAVRDHREVTLVLRVEVSALTAMLVKKGVCTTEEIAQQTGEEAEELERMLEGQFPGVKAVDNGLTVDIEKVTGWMKEGRWKK